MHFTVTLYPIRYMVFVGERGEIVANEYDDRAGRPNLPSDCVELPEDLDSLSAVELADRLEHVLDAMTEDTYDEALIDAYLEALDRKAPMPEMRSTGEAYADFQRTLRNIQPEPVPTKRYPRRFRNALRIALVAALVVAVIFGGMVTAQAAGIDVFGAIARWTEELFSFGTIHDDNVEDTEKDELGSSGLSPSGQFDSLQDALDYYGITEVKAPAWLPEGYELTSISVTDIPGTNCFVLDAIYGNGTEALCFNISRYVDIPDKQVEKEGSIVSTFEHNGISFTIIENAESRIIAWTTEQYECYINGAYDLEQSVLEEIAYSMFNK